MRGDVLIGAVAALRSRTDHRFRRRSHLVELVGMVVGLLAGTLLMGTFKLGVGASMKRVILLLSSIRGVGPLGGVCTLGTCCMLRVAEGVAVSSKRSGRACK